MRRTTPRTESKSSAPSAFAKVAPALPVVAPTEFVGPPRPTHLAHDRGAIRIDGVSVRFKQKGADVIAVERVDLDIRPGEFVALLGPSGCGKSTLLNAIGGMVKPTTGQIAIDGAAVREPSATCGVVFQQHSLFPWMTALGNIAFGPRRLGHPDPERTARELLKLVGLEQFAHAYPYQLSGGMQQRVGIARALATRPPVLLMDEPFGALDAQTREVMHDLILHLFNKERSTILFVTHDVEEAIYLGHRVVVMAPHPGRIDSIHVVPLPAARHADMKLMPEFLALKKTILQRIHTTSGVYTDQDVLQRLTETESFTH